MLKKIERVITYLLDYDCPDNLSVAAVLGLDRRTKHAIGKALGEVGFPAYVTHRPRPPIYSELNRNGQEIWRAA